MLHNVRESVFANTEGYYLAHSCNCIAVWGAGIALQFKKLYPASYKQYYRYCQQKYIGGTCLITTDNVICLMASWGYGTRLSKKQDIIYYTEQALAELMVKLPPDAKVRSNKFNSGLFGIEWEITEKQLLSALAPRPDLSWTVCTID